MITELDDQQKEEIESNWKYFASIHAGLAKHPMFKNKWIVIVNKTCVDMFYSLEDAIKFGACRFPSKITCIIKFSMKLNKCEMASTHVIEKKMFDDPIEFGPFRPVNYGVGFGKWVANESLKKESYPVKSIEYVNMHQPVIKGDRYFGNEGDDETKWVVLRLCTDNDKQYYGLYIGDVANCKFVNYDEKSQSLVIAEAMFSTNPVIYVPSLNKCVYGCECWWRPVSELKKDEGISDEELAGTRKFFGDLIMAAARVKDDHKVT